MHLPPALLALLLLLLLLPHHHHLQVWNKEDPCLICGFDMEPLGAAQALASQPEGTLVVCFSTHQPGSLVLACKQKAGSAGGAGSQRRASEGGAGGGGAGGGSKSGGAGSGGGPRSSKDAGAAGSGGDAAGGKQTAPGSSGGGSGSKGLLQAVVSADDLSERRLETWLRDLAGATHVLDVYRNKLHDKRALLGLNNFTRLRAMDPLDAYDDILI